MSQKNSNASISYDVFNGDADGIFAIHQLRLASPRENSRLVTGVKRDIMLLKQIHQAEDSLITVVDVSLDKNRSELAELLEQNNQVLYIDHHYAGDIPSSQNLEHHIEPSAETCSSLIVNTLLQGKFSAWAVCGAFGDNLDEQARALAESLSFREDEVNQLKEIGELFNYNGYGSKIEDLHFHPAELFKAVQPFVDPFEFYRSTDIIATLRDGFAMDMTMAADQKDISQQGPHRVYLLPDASWARRISGVFSNHKARERPDAAHAVIVENSDGSLQVSVRAPLEARKNADTLCRKFPTGGGRAAAAGINNLPQSMLEEFTETFHATFNA